MDPNDGVANAPEDSHKARRQSRRERRRSKRSAAKGSNGNLSKEPDGDAEEFFFLLPNGQAIAEPGAVAPSITSHESTPQAHAADGRPFSADELEDTTSALLAVAHDYEPVSPRTSVSAAAADQPRAPTPPPAESVAALTVTLALRTGVAEAQRIIQYQHESDHALNKLLHHATQLQSNLQNAAETLGRRLNSPISPQAAKRGSIDSESIQQNLTTLFLAIQNILGNLHVLLHEMPIVIQAAIENDYSLACCANGYRSLLRVLERAIDTLQAWLQDYLASSERASVISLTAARFDEFGVKMFKTLMRVYSYAARLAEKTKGSLFLDLTEDPLRANILRELESSQRECFYGRYFGFYYPSEVQQVLQTIGLALVSYSHGNRSRTSTGAFISSLASGVHYWTKPNEMAKRFIEYTSPANASFTKQFWGLLDTTLARHWGKVVGPALTVNHTFQIPVREEELERIVTDENFALVESLDLDAGIFAEASATINVPSQPGEISKGRMYVPHEGDVVYSGSQMLRVQTSDVIERGTGAWVLISTQDATAKATPSPSALESLREAAGFAEAASSTGTRHAKLPPPPIHDPQAASPHHIKQPHPRPLALPPGLDRFIEDNDTWILNQMTGDGFDATTVSVRLLSHLGIQHQIYNEDINSSRSRGAPTARGLIIHCHGGGFVAQSSQSHEMYLRRWAKVLRTPILSIDYSLAPEHRYPTALQEVVYAYRWAITHATRLGSTAERVIVVGDSAGGNLVTALALRCIVEDFRLPDAVFAIYPALETRFHLSPSRLLSVMDPLLPEGVLRSCLEAYTGHEATTFDTTDPFLSPLVASDALLQRLPPMYLLAAGLDPLLDDSIMFARRLRDLGCPVHLRVFNSVPHGFLSLPRAGVDIEEANDYCIEKMREVLAEVINMTPHHRRGTMGPENPVRHPYRDLRLSVVEDDLQDALAASLAT
ncbi:uncharacterized protein MONBRDRAFT_25836 [Monosiga brevicollis MX1]|uniref:Hormone-sensitive lipase n=1 Tax=Monosiga brevicollis TaxID=81824 RepID=A9V0K9_MONBE|nr:uncharacterized protein MONBRDRAFT_25836 [Monosiga brevicollis MX1]EDQ89034.1 predicted protein [Monosiga brevicollis MX1]|eukprot:XP_001746139.1 hypothetical protein [Monosiga brevicollis MX1]